MTARPDSLDRRLAAAIQVGTLAAAALMVAGVALDLVTIAWYGLLVLTLTPIVQLGLAAIGFGRRRELRHALIAALVVGLLLVGLLAAALFASVGS